MSVFCVCTWRIIPCGKLISPLSRVVHFPTGHSWLLNGGLEKKYIYLNGIEITSFKLCVGFEDWMVDICCCLLYLFSKCNFHMMSIQINISTYRYVLACVRLWYAMHRMNVLNTMLFLHGR